MGEEVVDLGGILGDELLSLGEVRSRGDPQGLRGLGDLLLPLLAVIHAAAEERLLHALHGFPVGVGEIDDRFLDGSRVDPAAEDDGVVPKTSCWFVPPI